MVLPLVEMLLTAVDGGTVLSLRTVSGLCCNFPAELEMIAVVRLCNAVVASLLPSSGEKVTI